MIRRSFTLLEVLIAIALTLSLLGVMFGFLFNLLSSRDEVIRVSMQQRAANALIERLERDLMVCLVGDETLGAGIDGQADRLSVLGRGMKMNEDAPNHVSRSFADVQRTEYRFDESRATLQARRSTITTTSNDQDEFEQIGENLFKVRFRYYDGSSWSESFNSLDRDALPRAIEVAFWFDPWPGESMPEDEEDEDFEFESLDRFEDSGFDEYEFSRRSDLAEAEEPKPDRRRVILIPDGGGDSSP